jgi:hypothetical protein
MTINDPNNPNRPYDRASRRGTSTMWSIATLVAVLIIGGIIYATSTSDRREASKILNPSGTTTGSGTATTPPATTTPSNALPPARSGK